ncbi:MAG: ABC transporter permease [Bacteroidales bacterium]|nr:ABC transporter permease [Bacteroidales bacterium]
MNLRIIGIIIRREYLNKVKKKSFLVTTFIVPVLVAGGMIALMAVMMTTKEKMKKIAVADRSGIVMPVLEDTETIDFVDVGSSSLDSVKSNMASLGYDAVLGISEINQAEKTVSADITSVKPLGIEMVEVVNNRINTAVENYRIDSYGIEGLGQIMKDVKADVKLNAYTMDEEGKETISETGVYAVVSMVLGIIIFMFVTLYGGMVMSAVIEEKSSRVVEVLVSSVKATELMFGKIIGIALVAVTQFLLWIVLSGALIGVIGSIAGPDVLPGTDAGTMEMVQGMGVDSAQLAATAPSELSAVMTTVRNMPLGLIACTFLVFFVFGYMLYASMFAAIGSAVENEGDTQQLQLPVTIPLLVAYMIAIYAFKAPDSAIAFWGSIIPFTSPIVMLARIPFGVPTWELVLSVALLIGTFVLFAWASAKIYKVGILMFGKKSTWKDLWKWFNQK